MEMIMQPQNRFVEEVKTNAYLQERTIYINEEITADTEFVVNRMLEKIVARDEKEGTKEPINIKISSPGGSVFATLSIIANIESLKERGYIINGYTYGMCMSGAFKILISCSNRCSQRNTRFLYHQVQSYEYGYTSVERKKRDYQDLEALWQRCQEVIMKYTKITKEQLDKITREDRDVCLWPEEALELGVIDKII
jgi:ATP-dependent protease ClpP protease subunit